MKKTTARTLFIILCVFVINGSAAAQKSRTEGHWVSAWATSVMLPMSFPGLPPEPSLEDRTIRMIVRPTIGARQIRIKLSNEFGSSPLVIDAARIALTDAGPKIKSDTDRELTFGGNKKVTVPAGAPILSDPVDLSVTAFSEVSISIHVASQPTGPTSHFQAQEGSYVAGPGDLTARAELPSPAHKPAWYFLSSLQVWVPNSTTTIVALGDSITQGTSNKPNQLYIDYPNQLAHRLASEKNAPHISVVNQGIGGNRILHDGAGVSALARFDRDVLSVPGVTSVILLEGINDIGFPRIRFAEIKNFPVPKENPFAAQRVSAEEMIVGLKQIIARAHEHGIKIYGATLTPFEGTNSYDADGESVRQAVNHWIRTTKDYDGIFDFDALLRDPAHPTKLRAEYDSGDNIHPSPAGYKAMADAISLPLLKNNKP